MAPTRATSAVTDSALGAISTVPAWAVIMAVKIGFRTRLKMPPMRGGFGGLDPDPPRVAHRRLRRPGQHQPGSGHRQPDRAEQQRRRAEDRQWAGGREDGGGGAKQHGRGKQQPCGAGPAVAATEPGEAAGTGGMAVPPGPDPEQHDQADQVDDGRDSWPELRVHRPALAGVGRRWAARSCS
jgi:hypothetical protein